MAKKAAKKRPLRKPKTVERELSVADAISEVYGEFTVLGEELREWYDNMPDGPQNGSKGDAVSEAAEVFEGLEEPDVPEALGVLKFKFTVVAGRGNSRPKRRDDAVQVLDAVIQLLNELDEDMLKKNQHRSARLQALNLPELGTDKAREMQEAAAGLHSELEQHKDDAEGAEFPGMFG